MVTILSFSLSICGSHFSHQRPRPHDFTKRYKIVQIEAEDSEYHWKEMHADCRHVSTGINYCNDQLNVKTCVKFLSIPILNYC